jgi:radical SAM superfamily enzyme YgiQ (UPF0313 family)
MIYFGVESGDERILAGSRKGITKEQIIQAVKSAKKAGLIVGINFIFGHYMETYKSIMKTFEFVKQLNPHVSVSSVMNPYPGSFNFSLVKEEIRYKWHYYPEYRARTKKPFDEKVVTICEVSAKDLNYFSQQISFEINSTARYLLENVLSSLHPYRWKKILFKIWVNSILQLIFYSFKKDRIFKKFFTILTDR